MRWSHSGSLIIVDFRFRDLVRILERVLMIFTFVITTHQRKSRNLILISGMDFKQSRFLVF